MSREMKDSGIEWIGEIPKGWKTCRLKNILSSKDPMRVGPFGSALKGNDFIGEGFWVYNQRTVLDNNFISNDTYISEDKYNELSSFQVEENDILITTRGSIGKICQVPEGYKKGIIHPCIIKFRIDDDLFIYPLIEKIFNWTDLMVKQLSKMSNSTTIDVVYSYNLKNLNLILAPLLEQQSIANHLDTKCAEIDNLISLQEEMIAELKAYKQSVITEAVCKGLDKNVPMKDSGVEWIGEIPKDWEIKKLKHIIAAPLLYGANESGIPYEENLPRYIRITDISDNNLRNDIPQLSLTETQASGFLLEDKDILFARSGGTVGKSFIFRQKYGRCAFAGYLIKASINTENSADFIYYYTLSTAYDEWKSKVFIQSTIQNIGANKYALLDISIPPLSEQQTIANYLDKKCANIDQLISIKQQKADELKEYKKSMIYEYVTGKKEVI